MLHRIHPHLAILPPSFLVLSSLPLMCRRWIRRSPRHRSALWRVRRGWERSRDSIGAERLSKPQIRTRKRLVSKFPSGAYVRVCSPWGSLTFTIKREARSSSVGHEVGAARGPRSWGLRARTGEKGMDAPPSSLSSLARSLFFASFVQFPITHLTIYVAYAPPRGAPDLIVVLQVSHPPSSSPICD